MLRYLRRALARSLNRVRVIRTSNAYTFNDPKPCAKPPDSSNLQFSVGTEGQDSFSLATYSLDDANPLHQALARWGRAVQKGVAPNGATKGLTM
jgi:hypothetical protein